MTRPSVREGCGKHPSLEWDSNLFPVFQRPNSVKQAPLTSQQQRSATYTLMNNFVSAVS
jgi:hypothetical protein